jgi:hypothetical protein
MPNSRDREIIPIFLPDFTPGRRQDLGEFEVFVQRKFSKGSLFNLNELGIWFIQHGKIIS